MQNAPQKQQGDRAMQMLQSIKTNVYQILPKVIGPERYMQSMLHILRTQPKLLQCTQDSLLGGLMQASREGMEIGIHCHLIPRSVRGTLVCVYQRDFRGDLALARRSGEYKTIVVDTVYQNDDYDVVKGTANRLEVKPFYGAVRGPAIFFYCATVLKNDESSFTIMGVDEMTEFMNQHAPKNRDGSIVGPWVEHFEAMAWKTVIKRHLKYQPISYDLQIESSDGQVLSIANAVDGMPVVVPEAQPEQIADPAAVVPKAEPVSTPEPVTTPSPAPQQEQTQPPEQKQTPKPVSTPAPQKKKRKTRSDKGKKRSQTQQELDNPNMMTSPAPQQQQEEPPPPEDPQQAPESDDGPPENADIQLKVDEYKAEIDRYIGYPSLLAYQRDRLEGIRAEIGDEAATDVAVHLATRMAKAQSGELSEERQKENQR